MKIGKYAIANADEYTLLFFYRIFDGCILTTRIVPTTFCNKKKAKRVMKRLNKYHGGGYFIIDYEKLTSNRY